jgi:hypothetical protein
MIDQNKLNQIIQFLNLEKINVVQKIELYCFPREYSKEFEQKVKTIQKDIGNNITLKIIYEGEIENNANLEFSTESNTNGVN